MPHIEKTVFLSYRRTNVAWALTIFKDLTYHGYDVFFDFTGLASGDFERVILEQIRSRAHFLVLLTPSALEGCSRPDDWLRRETEAALSLRRNIVPLMLEGFDFGSPGIAGQLTGEMATLKRYHALRVPADFFDEAMARLRNRHLNVALETILHPASPAIKQIAAQQQHAAVIAAPVESMELTADEYFERGFATTDSTEAIRLYTQTIKLNPNHAGAFNNRGVHRRRQGDLVGARQDADTAIQLDPKDATVFNSRGVLRSAQGDLVGARQDYDTAIQLRPNFAKAFNNRGIVREEQGDRVGARQDYDTAIQLDPNFADAFNNRGIVREEQGDRVGTRQDYDTAIQLDPKNAHAFNNRAVLRSKQGDFVGATEDFDTAARLKGR